MARPPTCSLCDGQLVREQDVVVAFAGATVAYRFAWVCHDCGAAFPIAMATPGVLASWDTHRPKYGEGAS